ncbi:restriction endonuclease subunit S [Mycoplasma buteonis]|uniref:restriction endonuclease subunit S n=1 Tax=Mycoplasma buteonis TaxID=171280 RepID=UPI00247FB3EF|nr:restriction endonuclease subunit S [Mycoplasma buteonis]
MGFEFNNIGSLCNIKRGKVISKKDIKISSSKYPVYSSQTSNDGCIGYIDTYDFDGEYVTWTTDGAYAGTPFYRKGKFNITNVSGLLDIKNREKLSSKFLFFWLSANMNKYVNKNISNPKMMSNEVANIQIPIPPIQIQNYIVNILERLEDLSKNSVNSIPKLIELNNKRYKYYLEKLFDF